MTASWSPSPNLWAPQRRGLEATIALLEQNRDVCLQAVTGGGKTEVAIQLLNWSLANGHGGSFYINRKLLIAQTAARFSAAGMPYGIRAAEYDDYYDFSAKVQICSADTERARVYQRKVWNPHFSKLIIVDEAHIQKSETMWEIIQDQKAHGARVVLITATPIGLSEWADELVVSGTMQEYREAKAIVPAIVKSIEQPDMRKVKRNQTGEYILDGKKKRIFTQHIVANVIDRWKRYNPDARPTMLYAPDVAGSVWFTEQFEAAGVRWAHVDATDAVVDGKRYKLSRLLWQDIQEQFKAGAIRGISSRMKTREGLDLPSAYHCILACPIGSLASFVQVSGRVLRYSKETPDHVLITDHAGNYLNHGSPNHDRPWRVWWDLPEHAVSSYHLDQIKGKKITEPIRCPRCEGERTGGSICPHCQSQHDKSCRKVIMEDGTLREVNGNLIRPRHVAQKPDTQRRWDQIYHGYKLKRLEMTFNQARAWFYHKHHYCPPDTLARMPKSQDDWYRHVFQVPENRLIGAAA